MYALRLWSVRHARGLNACYRGFEALLLRLHGLFSALGYERIERPVAAVERSVKSLLFDCRMCGQCILSSTGMSCPMNCPKSIRNGPCGGVRDDGRCEVKPEMRCVWVEAFAGSRRIPGGTEAMAQLQISRSTAAGPLFLAEGRAREARCPMRFDDEPVPGYPLPILPGHTSPGRFERVLRAGGFAVTTELAPPDSADPEDVYRRARVFDGYVDAINATDGSGANCHMSSLAVCALLTRVGYAPIMQISCRDKNRIAIQGDILGGAAMGVCNMLCLTGDGVQAGDHPQAKPVFDLDCMTLLDIGRTLRDEHRFQSGRKISYAPRVFFGAAENPSALPHDWRAQRLAKKIAAGAQFIQTQYCFDIGLLRSFMQHVELLGLIGKVHILAGVGPLRSAKTAEWMRKNVPGMHVPDTVVARLAGAQDQAREGRNICVELIQAIREMHGISGVHIMAYRQEESVAEIVERSGILDGRAPWFPGRDAPALPQRNVS